MGEIMLQFHACGYCILCYCIRSCILLNSGNDKPYLSLYHFPNTQWTDPCLSSPNLSWARGNFSAALTEEGSSFSSREGTRVSYCTEQTWSAVLQGKQLASKPEGFPELLAKPPPPWWVQTEEMWFWACQVPVSHAQLLMSYSKLNMPHLNN